MEKVKIVLDADVLIHFAKACRLFMLPSILSEYDHIVLSTVYEEVSSISRQIDNQINRLKNIRIETFLPKGEMLREYANLIKNFGKGESACMAYCRFTQNVVGSSNLRDITAYCKDNKIVFLTTIDFLYYAIVRGKMTKSECEDFVREVQAKGSKLPIVDFDTYRPNSDI